MDEAQKKKFAVRLDKLRRSIDEEIKDLEKIRKEVKSIEYDLKRS